MASGITTAINYILNFIAAKSYIHLEMGLSLPGVSLFNCVVIVLGFVLMYKILPETEGRTLEEIELHFSDKSKRITSHRISKIELDDGSNAKWSTFRGSYVGNQAYFYRPPDSELKSKLPLEILAKNTWICLPRVFAELKPQICYHESQKSHFWFGFPRNFDSSKLPPLQFPKIIPMKSLAWSFMSIVPNTKPIKSFQATQPLK